MIEARITDPVTVERDVVNAIVKSGRAPTIQFSKPGYTPELLRAVNRLCSEFEDGLEVRFFGHYHGQFDASVLTELQAARWVSVDCLTAISNEEHIGKLPLLNRLSFGVYKFDKPGFLATINVSNLRQLSLGETAKRNFDLTPLEGGRLLQTVFLEGHTRNVEVLSSLPRLQNLTLRAFPNRKDLKFLSDSVGLRSLTLVLGGRSSFGEFHHGSLEELILIRVRGLESIGSLARFPSLQTLHVEDQLQVQSINLAGAPLRRFFLLNCKGLAAIDGIDSLSDLVHVRVSRTKLDLEALANRDWPASMRLLALYSSSQKWNEATRAMLAQRGYQEYGTDR